MSVPTTPRETDSITAVTSWHEHQKNKRPGFEGIEKRLEVICRVGENPKGLRAAPKSVWVDIVSLLRAKIESTIHNEEMDAYVLTESSLFVFPNRVLLVTCGTTVLLESLSRVLATVKEYGCEVEWASFMRKNYSYPWEQPGPHQSYKAEYALLKSLLPSGQPYIFGPIDGDHYFFFVYDDVQRPCIQADTQVSLTMFDLDRDFCQCFFAETQSSDNEVTGPIRDKSGLSGLVGDFQVQDLQFDPCGYSFNAIKGDTYLTSHITPEEHCSFASWETNLPMATVTEHLQQVLAVYKPGTFSMVVIADPDTPMGPRVSVNKSIGDELLTDYAITNRSVNEFFHGHFLVKTSFKRRGLESPQRSNGGVSPTQPEQLAEAA